MIGEFAAILRGIVETIDRHGLSSEWLIKHKPKAEAFLDRVCRTEYRSQVAQGYKERITKYRDRLFVFLEHDGVAWNNNNAEYAIKQFAEYRLIVDGNITEEGLLSFLGLLGICVTCKYKNLNFLRFLLSRERDIDVFAIERKARSHKRKMEVYPKGFPRAYNRQAKYTAKGTEEAANTRGVGPLYASLAAGLRGVFTELHTTVNGVAFVGKVGKARLSLLTLRLNESDSARGLRYIVCLDRFAAYFGIAEQRCGMLFQHTSGSITRAGPTNTAQDTSRRLRTWKGYSPRSGGRAARCRTTTMKAKPSGNPLGSESWPNESGSPSLADRQFHAALLVAPPLPFPKIAPTGYKRLRHDAMVFPLEKVGPGGDFTTWRITIALTPSPPVRQSGNSEKREAKHSSPCSCDLIPSGISFLGVTGRVHPVQDRWDSRAEAEDSGRLFWPFSTALAALEALRGLALKGTTTENALVTPPPGTRPPLACFKGNHRVDGEHYR